MDAGDYKVVVNNWKANSEIWKHFRICIKIRKKKMVTAEWNIYNSKIKSLYGTSNLNSHIQQLNGVFKKQFIAKLQSNITKYPKMTSFADNNKPDTTEQKYMYI